MYVCLCNPFTDKDMKSALESGGVRKTPAQIYKACSGGQKPCCGSCLCMVRDIVNAHNANDDTLPLAAE